MSPSDQGPDAPIPPPEPLLDLLESLYGPPAVQEMLQRDLELARFLLARKLASRSALEECLNEQRRDARAGANPVPRLRKLLIQKKILTSTQVAQAGESMDSIPAEVLPESATHRLGEYVCVEKLGSGGMGEVWKAWDTVLGRQVALKILKADNPNDLARFRREAELSAKLSHPHIATIYGVGEDGGRQYLAMQYVEGTTLDKFPRKDRKLLIRLLRDTARAVDYAHQQGIVHRDLKPSNVMVSLRADGEFQAFVLDFGLAGRIEGAEKVTASGIVLGTPAYMSPEQARGAEADVRSDVYGLGATMYEILTNQPLFKARHVYELLKRVEDEDPPAPRRLDRTVDADLETIVLKCLEKDPSRRYRTAGSLAEDLDRYLEGEPVLARAPGWAYRLRKRLAKRKALVAMAAVAILLAGAVALLGRRATSAEAQALVELRKHTQTSLLAVLEVRRSGRTEHMRPFLERTEEVSQEAIALMPRKAEPHYRLGRMYRAVMDDAKALDEQNRAIDKEPDYGPALYERGVLLAREYRRHVKKLSEAALAVEGKRLADRGEIKPGMNVQLPSPGVLAQQDAMAKRLMGRMTEDLRKLETGAAGLTEGEKSCARGLMAWAEGKDEEAVKLLTAALAAAPGLEEGYEALASLHEERGRHEDAIRVLTAGHEHDRGYVPHLVDRGGARLSWGNSKLHRGEDPSELYRDAIEDCAEALKRSPESAEAWRWRAAARMMWGSYKQSSGEDPAEFYEQGLKDYDEALSRNPEHAELRRGRGLARMHSARSLERRGEDPSPLYQRAVEDYDEALKQNPEIWDSWTGRGGVRVSWGHYKAGRGEDPTLLYRQAIEDYDQALRRRPEYDGAWKGRGFAHLNAGLHLMNRGEDPTHLYQQAIEDFGEAIKHGSEDAESWTGRGGARVNWGLYKAGRGEDPSALYQGAIEEFGEALKRNSKHVVAWQWRGNARSNWGNHIRRGGGDPSKLFQEAIEDYGEALKRNAASAEASQGRGAVQVNWGIYKAAHGEDPLPSYAGALQDFANALAINLSDAALWRFQGNAYLNRARYKASRKAEIGPDYRAALESYQAAVRLNSRLGADLQALIGECERELANPQSDE